MAQAIRDFEKSFTSTNDLHTTSKQFYIAAMDTSNDESIVLGAAATDPVVGVVQNKPRAGEPALIRMTGTSKVVAGGTITRGDRVTTNSSGQAITTTTSGNSVVGIALASAVSGDIFEVQLTPGAKY